MHSPPESGLRELVDEEQASIADIDGRHLEMAHLFEGEDILDTLRVGVVKLPGRRVFHEIGIGLPAGIHLDFVDDGDAVVVRLEGHEGRVVAHGNCLDHEGAGTDGTLPEIGLLELERIDVGEILLGKGRKLGETKQGVGIGGGEAERNAVAADLYASDAGCLSVLVILVSVDRLEHGTEDGVDRGDLGREFVGPLDILGGYGGAIVPLDPALEGEGYIPAVRSDRIGSELRLEGGEVGVGYDQMVEQHFLAHEEAGIEEGRLDETDGAAVRLENFLSRGVGGNIPLLDVPVVVELLVAESCAGAVELRARDDEDLLVVEGNGRHILAFVLLELEECLFLGHRIDDLGRLDQALEGRVLGRVRVARAAGNEAVIILVQGQGGDRGVGHVPLYHRGAVHGIGRRNPELGTEIAFEFAECHLHADIGQVSLDGGHEIHRHLVAVVIDDIEDIVGVPLGILEELAGLVGIVGILRQAGHLPLAVGRHAVRDDGLSAHERVDHGFHINRVLNRLTDAGVGHRARLGSRRGECGRNRERKGHDQGNQFFHT